MIRFRASSVGNLLVGGNAITDKQLERLAELEDLRDNPPPFTSKRLDELEARSNDPNAKPLTEKMRQELEDLQYKRDHPVFPEAKQRELDELIAKRDADFEFGATAKNYIIDCWLAENFGAEEPVLTPQMQKGILCEDESIGVLTRQITGGFRVKNEQRFANDWFTGEPDIIDGDWVEDVKTSWSLKTFAHVEKPDPLYYAQGQVYMDLTGCKQFRLAHVLVDTPGVNQDVRQCSLFEEVCRKFAWQLPGGESNPAWQQIEINLLGLHYVSHIPEEQRIKTFEFHKDERFLDTLKTRVEQARKVYEGLTL